VAFGFDLGVFFKREPSLLHFFAYEFIDSTLQHIFVYECFIWIYFGFTTQLKLAFSKNIKQTKTFFALRGNQSDLRYYIPALVTLKVRARQPFLNATPSGLLFVTMLER